MKIPAHQIQNVLRLYFKQLGEGKILEKSGEFVMSSASSRAISSEGIRQTIIDKVAAGIVKKIISKASQTAALETFSGRQASQPAGKSEHRRGNTKFTYLLIDRHNKPLIRTAREIQPQRDHAPPDD